MLLPVPALMIPAAMVRYKINPHKRYDLQSSMRQRLLRVTWLSWFFIRNESLSKEECMRGAMYASLQNRFYERATTSQTAVPKFAQPSDPPRSTVR